MDMSRVSTCSIALIDQPPERAMEIIAAAGYEKIDLLEKLPHLSIFSDECDPSILKAISEANGLKIANLGTYVGGGKAGRGAQWAFHGWKVPNPERFTSFGFSSDSLEEQETELEQLCRAIDLAVYFGSRSIRVIPGNDDPKTHDKIVPWFKRSVEYAEENKIYMGVENHSAGIAGIPKLCVELVEKVGSPYFGILYEPGNIEHEGRFNYHEALDVMKEHIVHCHFKDWAPDKGYVMLGEGAINFPWIVDQLTEVGYDGDFALEYELPSPLDTRDADSGLKKFYEIFKAM